MERPLSPLRWDPEVPLSENDYDRMSLDDSEPEHECTLPKHIYARYVACIECGLTQGVEELL